MPPTRLGGKLRGTVPPWQLVRRLLLLAARVETVGVKEVLELGGWSQRRVGGEEEESNDDRRQSRGDDDSRQSRRPA